MNRACLPIVKSLFITLLAIASAAAAAEGTATKADPVKGEALFNAGDASRNLPACITCHGAAGNSSIAQNPKLAGQHAAYLHKQLIDFKGATRNNPVMSTIAKTLTEEDVRNVSAYLARQKTVAGAARNKDTLDLGKKIFRGGIAEKSVPACAACHSANGAGIPNQFPRLAGQQQEYASAQLTNFRSGTRKNSEPMTKIAKRLSDEEIAAVADYVAGLK